jgi:hypothetical protein
MTRRAVVFLAVVALLWANLPYLVGYAASTPQQHFGGFFLYEQDGYSYLAKLRQGARGAWTFHLPYTSEDAYQTGGVAYLFYLLTGRLAVFGLELDFIYHAARLLSSLLLLIVLWRFIARFVVDARWRLWSWGLILFSGGWGLLASYLIDQRYVAYELIAPDAFVFSILYGPPHVILGFALLLIWIGYTLDSLTADRAQLPRRLLVANVLGGLTALTREAYGPAFAGIFAAYLITLVIRQRRLPWRAAIVIALSSLAAGAYGVYLLVAFRTIPGYVVWSQQNPFESPGAIDFMLGFAPLLLLTVFSFVSRRYRPTLAQSPHFTFLAAWLIAGPIMAYLPIAISRRLIAGWQIPLCTFGTLILTRWLESPKPLRRIAATLAIVSVLPTTFLLIVGGTLQVSAQQPPLFITADQQAALNWLSTHTTGRDVVLSDWHFGNLVPTVAEARVFIGHPIETADFNDKARAVQHFFSATTSSAERNVFLQQWHITLVVDDSTSNRGATPDGDQLSFQLPSAFQHGDVAIYRVSAR